MSKVHILLATYNGEKYIKQQMDSILKQSYTDWKLFVSDDCSSDNTVQILREYETRHPDKIYILSTDNKFGGAKQNFSYLFSQCPEAPYYMFSDQDDVWLENKIERFITFAEQKMNPNEPEILYCDMKVVDNKLNVINDSFRRYENITHPENEKKYILMYNFIPGCVMLYNQKLRETVGTIPSSCFMHDWWLALVAIYFGKIYFLNEPLNLYRQHEDSVIGAAKEYTFWEDCLNIVKGMFHSPYRRAKKLLSHIQDSLNSKIRQGKVFYSTYRLKILKDDRAMIMRCIAIRNKKHRLKGMIFYFKYFRTKNFVKNILYGLVILFF